jgi:HEPN domain-containing protein
MTTRQLAAGYLKKCEDRLAMLEVLMTRKAWSDVIRESQEIVELALKGVLRSIGIDPPKWHDVGELLLEYGEKLKPLPDTQIRELAKASKLLRKEREFSFFMGMLILFPPINTMKRMLRRHLPMPVRPRRP